MLSLSLHTCSLALLLGLNIANAAIPIPQGGGPYGVTYQSFELVDYSRIEPFNVTQPRRLMVSRFDPVPKEHCTNKTKTEYISPLVATEFVKLVPGGIFPPELLTQFELEVCPNPPPPHSRPKFPVAIFGPGATGVRSIYSAFSQNIASYGYTIVNVDFTYNAVAVEFPNGDVIYRPEDQSNFTLEFLLDGQAKDFSFVLTSLGFSPHPNADEPKAVAFGHSFGGATAAVAVLDDKRFSGGINIDGTIYGRAGNTSFGTSQDFLLWGASGVPGIEPGHGSVNDTTWASFRDAQRNASSDALIAEISLLNTTHSSYTDAGLLVDLAGVRDQLPPAGIQVVGTISGQRMREVFSRYLPAFFDFTLGKTDDKSIFKKSPADFPDVKIVK